MEWQKFINLTALFLKPVLSAINTHEYSMAKWLIFYTLYKKTVKTSSRQQTFNTLIQNRKKKDFMTSFGIKSLYTQVPVKEVGHSIWKKKQINIPKFQHNKNCSEKYVEFMFQCDIPF